MSNSIGGSSSSVFVAEKLPVCGCQILIVMTKAKTRIKEEYSEASDMKNVAVGCATTTCKIVVEILNDIELKNSRKRTL
ncbi:hypothetical protein L195_g032116 [Trifolium pratense]|uniref:Uncharacterized protein n=1 Tax=Trifolium pratense TaxID=57577 RepID=A0A2K3LCA5_TRIPR|nr:hypothetical protein L195_g032116 [Trifolium pratense]